MGLESMGLGAIVSLDPTRLEKGSKRGQKAFLELRNSAKSAGRTLNTETSSAITKTDAKVRKLTRSVTILSKASKGIGKNLKRVSAGVQQLGMAALPVSAAMGLGVVSAAKYEKAVSGLRAVMHNASQEEMTELIDKSKELGIESAFSAEQAMAGMKQLKILGFDTNQIMASIGPTLDAAAVAGIDLAESAQVVGGSTRAMGMEVKKAGRVADVLTVAGKTSATTLQEMGQALAYGAAGATKYGMDLEETVMVLSQFANKMHKGSTGGMLLLNLVNSLTNPTQRAQKAFKALGVDMIKADRTGFRPMLEVTQEIAEKLAGIKDKGEAARLEGMMFAQRSGRAFNDLRNITAEMGRGFKKDLVDSLGAASKAAKIQLDNLIGKFTLFKSSLEGLAIAMFEGFGSELADSIEGATGGLNSFLKALNALRKPWKQNEDASMRFFAIQEEHGPKVTQMAIGIDKAITNVGNAFKKVNEWMVKLGKSTSFVFGDVSTAKITEWVATFTIFAGLITPIALLLKGVGWALSGVFGIMSPMLPIITALGHAFKVILVEGIVAAGAQLATFVKVQMTSAIGGFKTLSKQVLIASLRMGIYAAAIVGVVMAWQWATKENGKNLDNMVAAWRKARDDITIYLKTIHTRIIDWLLTPMRSYFKNIAKGYRALGKETPKWISDMASGFTPGAVAAAEGKAKKREGLVSIDRLLGDHPDTAPAKVAIDEPAKGGFLGDMAAAADESLKKFMADQQKGMKDVMNQMAASTESAAIAAAEAADSVSKEKCTKVNIDGREVAKANSKAERQIQRRGGKEQNWQPGAVVYHGAMPVAR